MKVELTLTQGGRIIGSYQLTEPGEYTLGRDPSCSIPVEDAEMSHQHARLRLGDAELLLEDLGSANGTILDEQRIQQAVAVKIGQKIQLGATVLEVKRVEEGASAGADVTMMPREVVVTAVPTPRRVQHVQQHELGEEVAHGGMGAVLRAKDMGIDRTVALKVALDGLNDSPELIERFKQEAKITGQLEHPGIVPVHELGTDEQGRAFYTMKFVQGVNLHDVLEKIKAGDAEMIARYPLSHLLTIFQKVCDAVAFAHSKGIIHRDLKPANIMIGEYGEVLVMDWGLAKIITRYPLSVTGDTEARESATSNELRITNHALQTLAGAVMGTPQFMAPEQAEGKVEEIDARSDIFSLGAILYNILTLHPPVTGETVEEILQKIRSGHIAHPSAYNPKSSKSRGSKAKVGGATMPQPPLFPLRHCPGGRVPESLSAVTMKALAVRKEDRYPGVPELQKDIEAYQGGFATSAEHASAFKLIWLLIKRHKVEFIVSHTALLILLVAGVAFTVKIAASERRARATLAELQKTAPEYRDKALVLMEQRKLDEALEKISYAVALVPEDAEYHNLQGNLLQSQFRLEEARDAYARALKFSPVHRLASENHELCKKLLKANPTGTDILPSTVHELQTAMQRQQRYVESYALLERFVIDKEQLRASWEAKLQRAGIINQGEKLKNQAANGMFTLGLPRKPIADLTPLRGMPLVFLDLTDTKVSDLTPLKGMPLQHLRIAGTQVSDLGPLRGMPLTYLNVGACPRVIDLSPLEGMPLSQLVASDTGVRDLRPLKGMPLESLWFGKCTGVRDISALAGMRLTDIDLRYTNPTDFSCLQGMPLTYLDLGETQIGDPAVLKGMLLRQLYLDGCKHLRDIRTLAEFKQLERLSLPSQFTDIEFLRALPNLQKLGYDHRDKLLPAVEFWKEYDAKKQKVQ